MTYCYYQGKPIVVLLHACYWYRYTYVLVWVVNYIYSDILTILTDKYPFSPVFAKKIAKITNHGHSTSAIAFTTIYVFEVTFVSRSRLGLVLGLLFVTIRVS